MQCVRKIYGSTVMKSYFKSSLIFTGLTLSLGLMACSTETRPARSGDGLDAYSGESKETPQDQEDSRPLPQPQPATEPEQEPAARSEKKPASISVGITASTVSTAGESYFPRGVKLADGSLVASYGQDIDGENTLKTEVSNDEGRSWSELGQIVAMPFAADGETVGDPTIVSLPSGTLISVYRNRFIENGSHRLQASASFDGGRTWSFQGNIEASVGAARAKQATLLVNSKGEVQVYYAKEEAGGFEDLLLRTSSDEGKTWSTPTVVATRSQGHSSFPSVVRLKDGSILVVFDTFRGDNVPFQILRSVQSNNDGLTWSAPKDLYIPAGGDRRAQSPQMMILDDGRPVVLFMSNEDPTVGFVIMIMIADGIPTFDSLKWLPQPVTAIRDAIAPAAIPLKDGEFLLTYERNRKVFFNKVSIKGGL